MDDFLDVTGASGVAYRFRRATTEDLPAMAGNLLVARGAAPDLQVLLCASAQSLAGAAPAATAALAAHRGAQLFMRLNVARTVRDAEHADIAAAVNPEAQAVDLG